MHLKFICSVLGDWPTVTLTYRELLQVSKDISYKYVDKYELDKKINFFIPLKGNSP